MVKQIAVSLVGLLLLMPTLAWASNSIAVPEPSTTLLLIVGAAGVGALRRFARK